MYTSVGYHLPYDLLVLWFLIRVLILPRAFSTVVADGQFSTLGIVLLALLADLAGAIKAQPELMGIPRSAKVANGPSIDTKAATDDVGEVICRGNEISTIATRSDSTVVGVINTESVSSSKGSKCDGKGKTKAVKKSRKKNTIDELFNNFL